MSEENIFSFEGTTLRSDYWWIMILSLLVLAFFWVVAITTLSGMGVLLASIASIVTLWIQIATTMRRLRDAGQNVRWVIALFVPFLNLAAFISFWLLAFRA